MNLGRRRIEINPLQAERLKTVSKELNLKNYELAGLLYLTPQTFSKIINGKASLTEANARLIAEKYPQYSAEWLLGLVDYRTREDSPLYKFEQAVEQRNLPWKRLQRLSEAVCDLSELSGHLIAPMKDGKIFMFGNYKSAEISSEDYGDLCNDILDYVEFKAGQLLRKALEKQKPAPGADTPGAGAGQKADGPLPADHTTEQEV